MNEYENLLTANMTSCCGFVGVILMEHSIKTPDLEKLFFYNLCRKTGIKVSWDDIITDDLFGVFMAVCNLMEFAIYVYIFSYR